MKKSIEKFMIDVNKVEINDDEMYDSNVYEDDSVPSNNKNRIYEDINFNIINRKSNSKNSKKSDDSITEINKNIKKVEDPYGSNSIN